MERKLPEFTSEGVNDELIYQFSRQFKDLKFVGLSGSVKGLDKVRQFNPFELKGQGEYPIEGTWGLYVINDDNILEASLYKVSGRIKITEGKIRDNISQEERNYPIIEFISPLTLKKL